MKTNFIDMVKHIGQKDREDRFKNLTSLIGVEYRIDCDVQSNVRNVVIPAKTKENLITLSAHWDSFPNSNGYNDNASSLAVLLSIQDQLPENISILFSDREESGGWGVSAYLKDNHPSFNINLDVVGYGKKLFFDTYGHFDQPMNLTEGCEYHPNVPFNDSYIFNSHGVDSILFITGNSQKQVINEIWERQHGGKLDNDITQVNEETMQMVSDRLLKYFDTINGEELK